MRHLKKLALVAVVTSLVTSGCGVFGGGSTHTYHAIFSRAVQIFEAGRVRVLGVNVGTITDIHNTSGGVEVTFTVNSDMKLPADVQAAVVPASLLGERYIQLLPAYTKGPTLQPGATIPESRTAVPAEPDELLRSLQNYLGALNPHTVTKFVENAATVLKGNGAMLNLLIHHGADVISELAAKRADLSQIIVQFEKVSKTLATRQAAVANLIHAYNSVAGTLVTNRAALEGTITGLRDASFELAQLLLAHRVPLHGDVANLTRTGQTLSKNIHHLVNTGHWASRLFHAAERAVDYDKRWLRLNNQGQALGGLIMMRIEQRLEELCTDLGLPFCTTPSYWAQHVPSMFCFKSLAACHATTTVQKSPIQQLTDVIDQVPALLNALLQKAEHIVCADAKYPDRCLKRKALLIKCAKSSDPRGCLEKHAVLLKCLKAKDVTSVEQCIAAHQKDDVKKLVDGLIKQTIGNPGLVSQATGGGGL
jgi:phospholipid/cholesterol/gamma-HCH transport system substrate-binding protein